MKVKKCPNCGWLITSKTLKCPKCQTIVISIPKRTEEKESAEELTQTP